MSSKDVLSYEKRLKTYESRWKVEFLNAEIMASAWFYYTGYSDIVCCPYCNVEISKWEPGDEPLAEHIKWSPSCPKLQDMQQQTANTKLGLCEKIIYSPTSIPENAPNLTSAAGIHQAKPTCYKHYAMLEKRTEQQQKKENSNFVADAIEEKIKVEDKLLDLTLCKICFSKEVGVVFLPCGHMVACVNCAPILNRCAVCRKNVEAHIRAFLS